MGVLFWGVGVVGVDLDEGAVDHDDIQVEVPQQVVEHGLEHALPGPVVEPLVDAVPGAEADRQVPPRCSGAGNPEDALQGLAVVLGTGATLMPLLTGRFVSRRHCLAGKTVRALAQAPVTNR